MCQNRPAGIFDGLFSASANSHKMSFFELAVVNFVNFVWPAMRVASPLEVITETCKLYGIDL